MAKMRCPLCQLEHEIVKTAAAPATAPTVHPDQQEWHDAHHAALMRSGLPVLVCPSVKAGTQTAGGVLVAAAEAVDAIVEHGAA
jgi:hypothetical protein